VLPISKDILVGCCFLEKDDDDDILLVALGLDFEVFSTESLWALLFFCKDIRSGDNTST
jgi:hypothetical protein